MNILIIAPMLKEYHAARESLGAKELDFISPYRLSLLKKKKLDVFILNCLFDCSFALQQYKEYYPLPDLLMDTGSCASMSRTRPIGSILRAVSGVREDLEVLDFESPSDLLPSEAITGVRVLEVTEGIHDSKKRNKWRGRADIITMETLQLYYTARSWGAHFISLRTVSDYGDEQSQKDFNKNLRPACLALYSYISDFLNDLSH